MLYLFVANLSSVNTSAIMDNFYLDPATPEQAAVLGYPGCAAAGTILGTEIYGVV